MSWSISVKTVGNTTTTTTTTTNPNTNNEPFQSSSSSSTIPPSPSSSTNNNHNNDQNIKNFTIQVEPNEFLSSLHRKIEAVTGLKSSQQRLIYRGRLISSGGCDANDDDNDDDANNHNTTTNEEEEEEEVDHDTNNHNNNIENGENQQRQEDNINPLHRNNDNGVNNTENVTSVTNTITPTTNMENKKSASLSSSSSPTTESRICDVVGLTDGQTIHLVPRPIVNNNDNHNNIDDSRNTTATTTNNNNGESNNGSGTTLLAALLGLGSNNNNNNNNNNTNNNNRNNNDDDSDDDIDTTSLSMPRLRTLSQSLSNYNNSNNNRSNRSNNNNTSTASANTSRRRNNYRRSENDPLYPEPCTLEPVRQGLMTLHTMIGEGIVHSEKQDNDNVDKDLGCEESSTNNDNKLVVDRQHHNESPLDFKRKWYKGQWIDARDTVNQWLEATIIDIVTPHDILNSVPKKRMDEHEEQMAQGNIITKPYIDPAIGANDLIGRKRLLLEPTPDPDDTTLSSFNNNDEYLVGFQERPNNDSIQLLKIHYNGWPHRWDEWIRSDSERIRPFRTRSRHVQSRYHLNPAVQTIFHAAPSTHVVSDNDEIDRMELLPEIYEVMDTVQGIFDSAVNDKKLIENRNEDDDNNSIDSFSARTVVPLTMEEQLHLSYALKNLEPDEIEGVLNIVQGPNDTGKSVDVTDIVVEELEVEIQHRLFCFLNPNKKNTNKNFHRRGNSDDESNMLPWKEEYAHPGIGNLEHRMESKLKTMDKKKLQTLAPLLDRLGRVLVDFAPHIASIADSIPDDDMKNSNKRHIDDDQEEVMNLDHPLDDEDDSSLEDGEENTNESNPEVSLRPSWALGRSRDVVSDTTPLLSPNAVNSPPRRNQESTTDPDYVDFVNGFIGNPTRNFGSQPRSSARRNNSDSLSSSLLSAFLASAAGSANADDNEDDNGPRIVRLGGSGGGGNGTGGIDIHIHAIVTGPNGTPTGLTGLDGITMPSSTNATTTRNTNSTSIANSRSTGTMNNVEEDDEELGLFSELYAERSENRNDLLVSNRESEIEIEDDQEEDLDAEDGIPQLLHDEEEYANLPNQDERQSSPSRNSSGSSRRSRVLSRMFRRALSRRNNNRNNSNNDVN